MDKKTYQLIVQRFLGMTPRNSRLLIDKNVNNQFFDINVLFILK